MSQTSDTPGDPLAQMRQRLKDSAQERTSRRRKPWSPPQVSDFGHGIVLSFDQTLTKTGFALVRCDASGLAVLEGSVLKANPPQTGFEGTYAKAEEMGHAIDEILLLLAYRAEVVVHEMPAAHGHRTESSLLAGLLVRQGVARVGLPVVMVSKQSTEALLLYPGNRANSKPAIKATVETLIASEDRTTRYWNYDVTDAVANALTWLKRKKDPS